MRKNTKINKFDIIGICLVVIFVVIVFSNYEQYYISKLDYYMSCKQKNQIGILFTMIYFFLPIKQYFKGHNFFRLFYYLLPVMVLSDFLFAQYYAVLAIILAVIMTTVFMFFGTKMFMLRKNDDKKSRARKIIYARKSMLFSVLLMSIPSVYMMKYAFASPSYVGESDYDKKELTDENYELKEIISENSDILFKLRESEWEDTTEQEKVNVLATILDIESEYLGIDKEINVVTENLPKLIAGNYSDEEALIRINREILKDRDIVIDCIFHEIFHAYQYKMMKLFDENNIVYDSGRYYGDIVNWKENEQEYTIKYEEGYYVQALEIAARHYAKEQKQIYLDVLQ